MLSIRSLSAALTVFSLCGSLPSRAAGFEEDFASDPATRGWSASGDTNLFLWDSAAQNLQVTWDSSQTNSYYYRPLGITLSKDSDFTLELDLRLSDIATTTKTGPFEIAVGFLNFAEATAPSFERGSGVDAAHGPRDLVELDYFPAGYFPDFGDVAPSLSPSVVSADNGFQSGFDLVELTTNDLFHISLAYSASNQTLRTVITRNGTPFGPIDDVSLGTIFGDFHVDTVAICSYSDYGDDYDSVLAHGVVDNFVFATSIPSIAPVSGRWNDGTWQVQFASQSNWVYTLERTVDFASWTAVGDNLGGTGSALSLEDTNAPPTAAFYRVRATRP